MERPAPTGTPRRGRRRSSGSDRGLIDIEAAISALPAIPEGDCLEAIRGLTRGRPAIVLDDDPTGTQTVRDVSVLTAWPWPTMRELLEAAEPVTYLSTNSRALAPAAAADLGRRIGSDVARASRVTGRKMSVISRSDSTLRGHFPVEVDALIAGLGTPEARIALIPFFGDGGRVTIGDRHWVRRADAYVPVEETEFARDPVFGYRNGDLRAWVREKADPDRPVTSVSVAALRSDGPSTVGAALRDSPPGGVVIVNAVAEADVELAALGVLQAETDGLDVVVRSAASYVRARAGQPVQPILSASEMPIGWPGLVLVGSHVATTTTQVEQLLAFGSGLRPLELAVDDALDPRTVGRVVRDLAAACDRAIAAGETPVVVTSRALRRAADATGDLDLGAQVSKALAGVAAHVDRRPAWCIAKGGITSSDVATYGLGIRRATVVGQLAPGIPVWRCGPEARWAGLAYVIFPGNVGDDSALLDAVDRLSGGAVRG